MEESKMKELMMDYIEGNLTDELRDFVSKQIDHNEKWANEYDQLKKISGMLGDTTQFEPDARLREEFEAMLAGEMAQINEVGESSREAISINWKIPKVWMQAAAAVVLLVSGIMVGLQLSGTSNNEEMQALRNEIKETKQLVINSLKNESASARINAVNVSYNIGGYDDDIVKALIHTLNNDKNANVRLAALDALSNFTDERLVRDALVASLATQDKPVVQIALINLMVHLKEKRAVQPLQNIMHNDAAIKAVKEEASYGIYKLS